MLGLANVVKLLIAHGANVNAQDELKFSPLHWAAAKGDLFYYSYFFYFNSIIENNFYFSLFKIIIKKVMRMLQRY